MKDYFVFGIKNLKKRGIRSWLTLLGIFVGIAAVVSLISLGTALKDTVNAQFGISSTELITVQAGGLSQYGPVGTTGAKFLTKEDSRAIERIGNVEITLERKIESIILEFNDEIIFGMAASVSAGKEEYMYEFLDLKTEIGKLIYEQDRGKILLGNNFLYGDKNGFGKDMKVNDKIIIENKEFRISGFLGKKGSFIIDGLILMDERDLNDLKNFLDNTDIILVKVKDRNLMEQTKEEIEKLLRERRKVKIGEEDFEVSTPEAMLATVNQILMGVQIFIVIIASVSIFIGAVGIANTMTTSTLERKKEIGIMKAIGAKNKDIFLQFFIEAGLLGLIGGLFGIVGGLGVGYLGVNALNSFLGTSTKLNIDFLFLIFVLAGCFFVGSLSGVIPAMHASKLNPVEALRE